MGSRRSSDPLVGKVTIGMLERWDGEVKARWGDYGGIPRYLFMLY